jgi:hypothetical protein
VILACSHGFDCQVWQSGRLKESRWRAELDDPAEVALLRRAAGLDAAAAPEAAQPAWQARPWTEAPFSWRRLLRDETAVMAGIAALAVFALCLELGMAGAYTLRRQLSESHTLALQEALGERLQYRLEAERLRTVNEEWAALRPAYTHLEIVAEFTRLMEGQPFELVDWEYQKGGLQVTLRNPELDSREVITRLESGDMFRGAKIEPGLRPDEHDIAISIEGVM